MGIYVGVNGTPKEVTAVYVGVNGVPKECSDIYVGVNGTPKSCYSGVKPGETIFTSSTTFTVPKGVKKIDCFCVGGGGGGDAFESITSFTDECGCGGGGGYTTTKIAQSVTPGSIIPVVVGAGGTSGNFVSNVTTGSSSSIGSICSANGGGIHPKSPTLQIFYCGGSGGGGNGRQSGNGAAHSITDSGKSDGGMSIYTGNFLNAYYIKFSGQGTTTRYFGESNGTLYAGGGGGGGGYTPDAGDGATTSSTPTITIDGKSVTINVGKGGAGGGGDGSYYDYNNNKSIAGCSGQTNTGGGGGGGGDAVGSYPKSSGGSGGSGICIIRWTKDYFE